MKRVLVWFAVIMMMASCALAQSELPKLHLSEIKDKDKITETEAWYTVYETGDFDKNTYLYARYNGYGELDSYDFQFDCGCYMTFQSNGMTYDPNECLEGIIHTAPVVHPKKLELLDEDVITALNKLMKKQYTYAEVKTPIQMGKLTQVDAYTFILEDMGYDEVAMYNDMIDDYAPFDAELTSDGWKVVFPWKTSKADARVRVCKGEKLSYYKNDEFVLNELAWVFQYFPGNGFWLDGGYRYNTNAQYDEDGQMVSYGYRVMENGYEWFMRYNMRNELLSFAYDLPDGDHWFYTPEEGWEVWKYGADDYSKANPPDDVIAAIRPPIEKQSFKVEAAAGIEEMKGTDVPFVLVDASVKAALEEAGAELDVVAYPPQGQSVRYELKWTKELADEIVNADGIDLVIPWPYGLKLEWAKQHEFVVEHTLASGETEAFSTIDGTAQRTEAGLLCHVDSFSPFIMNYGTEQEMQRIINAHVSKSAELPTTGDNSSLFLWTSLLMVTLCAYIAGRKIRV